MKIALITTYPDAPEVVRVEQEVKALGHEYQLINLLHFNFFVKDQELRIEHLENLDADVVIVRGVFNAIKSISTVMDYLKKRGIKVFDNNLSQHKYAINKVTDLVKLSIAGIFIPDTYYAREYEKYDKFIALNGYPLVIKSTRMGQGAGVYKVDSEGELKRFISEHEALKHPAKDFILQKFIDYEFDIRVLIVGEDMFAMRRKPRDGDFRANFSLGGSVEKFDLDQKDKELALAALRAIDMGVGGVDILIDKNGNRYILEVNHTAGLVGMEKATGEKIARLYVVYAIKNAS